MTRALWVTTVLISQIVLTLLFTDVLREFELALRIFVGGLLVDGVCRRVNFLLLHQVLKRYINLEHEVNSMPEPVLHVFERFARRGTRLRDQLRVSSCHGENRGWSDLSGRVGSHMCIPLEKKEGGPVDRLVLLSSLKLRRETRSKGLRPTGCDSSRGVHMCVPLKP